MDQPTFFDVLRWGVQQNVVRPERKGAVDRAAAAQTVLTALLVDTSSPAWRYGSANPVLAQIDADMRTSAAPDQRTIAHLLEYVELTLESGLMFGLDMPSSLAEPLPSSFDLWTFCTEFAQVTPPPPHDRRA